MIRRRRVVTLALVTLAGALAGSGSAAAGLPDPVVCDLEGTGEVSPGVTVVPQEFGVTIELDVVCDANDPALSEGQITGSGAGFGGCGFSQLAGTATIDWGNDNVSEMEWAAVGAARSIHFDGDFVAGPYEGKRFKIFGTLGAEDQTQCAGSGITHVTFTETGVIV